MSGRTQFGKYELVQRLAHGGMGETFRAEMVAAAGVTKQVCIKKMLPQVAQDPALVRSFVDEARLSASLTHSNIAQVFDFGEVDGEYFIAMEWVDGRALSTAVKRGKTLGWDRLPFQLSAYIVVKLLEGLQYAHTRTGPDGLPLNLVHRDLTPDNVLLGFEGEVKLVDFGVAKTTMVGRQQTEPGLVKGKFRYVSPEQAVAKPLDARSDLFTVGVVLYQLLTGELPFAGDEYTVMQGIVDGNYVPPRVRAGDVPEPLDTVVRKALERNPGDRFGSAREMLDPLSRWLYGVSPDFSGELLRELMGHLFDADLLSEGRLFISHENAREKLMSMSPKRQVELPTQEHRALDRETKPSNPAVGRAQAATEPEHSAVQRHRTPVGLVLLALVLGMTALGVIGYEVREAAREEAQLPGPAKLAVSVVRATSTAKPDLPAALEQPVDEDAPAAQTVAFDAESAPAKFELTEAHETIIPTTECFTVGKSWRAEVIGSEAFAKPFGDKIPMLKNGQVDAKRFAESVKLQEEAARRRSSNSSAGRMLEPLGLLTPVGKLPKLFALVPRATNPEAGRFCPFTLSDRASEQAMMKNALRIDGVARTLKNPVARVEPDDKFVVRSFKRAKNWVVSVSDVKPPWPVMMVDVYGNEDPIVLDRGEVKIESPTSVWFTVPVHEKVPFSRTVTITLAPGQRLDETSEDLVNQATELLAQKRYTAATKLLNRCIETFPQDMGCANLLVESYRLQQLSRMKAK